MTKPAATSSSVIHTYNRPGRTIKLRMNRFVPRETLVLSEECSRHLNGSISHRQGRNETSDVRHSLFVGTFRSFQSHFLCIERHNGFLCEARMRKMKR